jgi:5'-3' exonuclease
MGDSTDGIEGMKGIGKVKAEKLIETHKSLTFGRTPPEASKLIYEKEGFGLDAWMKCLLTVSIWRNPMPKELLENELIAEIAKTIPSLRT